MTIVFQYRGSKLAIASETWPRLGDVDSYCEPFGGSLATLLARPSEHKGKLAVVGDICAALVNFFRAVKHAPKELADLLNFEMLAELDVLSRNRWLHENRLPLERLLLQHPDAFDLKAAAWYCYYQCLLVDTNGNKNPRKHCIVSWSPDLMGLDAEEKLKFLLSMAQRLVGVRVLYGSWERTIRATPPGKTMGFVLDPPYSEDAGRKLDMYQHDETLAARDAARWAYLRGKDPRFRIAFCGFEGEHSFPGWTELAWGSTKCRHENRGRERIWFSPHCLKVETDQHAA